MQHHKSTDPIIQTVVPTPLVEEKVPPMVISPSARAIFAAFDNNNSISTTGITTGSTSNVGTTKYSTNTTKSSVIKSSSFVQHAIQTAGWRNRYSQAQYYPYRFEQSTILRRTNTTNTNDDSVVLQPLSLSSSSSFNVQQIQCGEIDGTYGTGATVWPASIVLLKYLEYIYSTDHPSLSRNPNPNDQCNNNNNRNNQPSSELLLLDNKIIIDLGSGTGITSIACAYIAKPKYIICTDGIESVVQLAHSNIQRADVVAVAEGACKNNNINNNNNRSTPNDDATTSNNNNDTVVQVAPDNDDADDATTTIQKNEEVVVLLQKDDGIKKNSISASTTTTTTTTATSTSNSNTTTITTDTATKLPIIYINNCPIRTEYYWWGSGTIQLPKDNNDDEEDDDNDNYNFTKQIQNDIVVIVSDCVLPKLYPIMPLVEAMDELLITPASIAIVSYEYRYYKESYDPKTQFIHYCTMKKLIVQTIPSSHYHPIYQTDDIEIWHIYRSKS